MKWYRISLSQARARSFVHEAAALIRASGNRPDLGLFGSRPSNEKYHFYLPPPAEFFCGKLLAEYSADSVEKPDSREIFELAVNENSNAFAVWFPGQEAKRPILLVEEYDRGLGHRRIGWSEADAETQAQIRTPFHLIWQRCDERLSKRFYVPGYGGYLPFFLSGDETLEMFKSGGSSSLNEEQLLKGILYGLFELNENPLPWHQEVDHETLHFLLDVLGKGFGFDDPEKLVLDTAASCRSQNGAHASRGILQTGLRLLPFSSKVRSDLICDTWSVSAERNEIDLLRAIPEWVMETSLLSLLEPAREYICYYGLCALVLTDSEVADIGAFLEEFVYPNVTNRLLKVRIKSVLENPNSFSIRALAIDDPDG